jgi:hypothetical protein
MAVRLDKWQNIVGVGWGKRRTYIFLNEPTASGGDANISQETIAPQTREELAQVNYFQDDARLASTDDGILYRFESLRPFAVPPIGPNRAYECFNTVPGLGAVPAGYSDDVYFGEAFLNVLQRINKETMYFAWIINASWDTEAEEIAGFVTGTVGATIYFDATGKMTIASETSLDINGNEIKNATGFRYDGPADLVVSATREFTHSTSDFKSQDTGGGLGGGVVVIDPRIRSFIVVLPISLASRTIGDAFFLPIGPVEL